MSEQLVSRRRVLALGAAAAAAGLVGGCGAADPVTDLPLDIACGEPGGTYIQFGRLLGAAIRRTNVAGSAKALQTHGSVDNLRLLKKRSAMLAMTLADSAAISQWRPMAVGRVYQNYLQCVVRADSQIRTVSDLATRSISIGAPGSGTAQTAQRLLDTSGLLSGDTQASVQQLDLATAAAEVAAGTLDALIWSGGLPAPAIVALSSKQPVRLIDLAGAVPALNQQYGGVYQPAIIAANTYGQAGAVATIGVSNFLVCTADLPDQVAAALVDVLIDSARDLVPEPSVGIQYLTAETLIDTSPLQLHAGAVRRYQERHG